MRLLSLISLAALLAFATPAQTESVYKLKDASGATVYSDKPDLPGTTSDGKVKLAPGPSAEQQQEAEQKVQQMERHSDEMRQSRLDKEQQRNEDQNRDRTAVKEVESSGVGVVDQRRRDPKARIPLESRDGGEHPIYELGKGPPVRPVPLPAARPGRR
jgi:TolA-binding protein